MPLTLEDFVGGIEENSKGFFKHLDGLKDEQWDWKPYVECKSIRETLIHLLVDDKSLQVSIETGGEPDYEAISNEITANAPSDIAELVASVKKSNEQTCSWLLERFKDTPLDENVTFFGFPFKLGLALSHYAGEFQYHTGQVAFIRMASDPSWDYYAAIYGFEG